MVWGCSENKIMIVKKCMEYEVEGSRPRGGPKRTLREVVQRLKTVEQAGCCESW